MIVRRPADQRVEGLSFLREIPLGRLLSYAKPRNFLEGAQISDGSGLSEAAWLLLSGSCELRKSVGDGRQERLSRFGPGEAFGVGESSDPQDPQTTAVATSDSVLLCFDRTTLELIRAEKASPTSNGNGYHRDDGSNGINGHNGDNAPADRIVSLERHEEILPRRVVTLGFLSADLPAQLISEQLARSLHAETEAAVVLVRLEQARGDTGGSGQNDHLMLQGDLPTASGMRKTDAGFYQLTLSLSQEGPSAAGVSALLNQLSQFRYVLIEAQAGESPAPWLFDLLSRSDLTYLFHRAKNEAVYHLDQIVRQARIRGGSQASRLKAIACLTDNEPTDGFDLLAQRMGSPVHFYVRGCPIGDRRVLAGVPPASFLRDVRRLAREVGGCMVGLALSSGAAKGFAHIGVIQVLEENGLEVDVVAGSSMGAYVGCLWCHGADGAELERLARELEGRWQLWSLLDPVFPPRQGFLRGFAVKRRLERSIGDARFSDMITPLRVVATNLTSLERKVFSSGVVSVAVHASIAVPGICVPITIDGETYIDGGIMDPLPVEVLREMGVSRVIAVDAIPSPEKMRYAVQAEAELAKQKSARKFFRKVMPIDQQLNYFARGNLFEILMRSVHGAQIRVAEASCQKADLLLRPDILDDRWLDFRHPGKFIRLGREVALRHLDELKSLLGRKDNQHEHPAKPLAVLA
jgi:NTE family protein